jgi:branched-chain amino acid transport system substrate-binding protein
VIGHKFAAAYRGRFKFAPSWPAAGGYAAVLTYAEAVRTVGSTDKVKIVNALEGLKLELPVGMVTIRPEDHQAVVPAFWGKSHTDHAYRVKVLSDVKIISGEDITQPSSETGCRMKK